MRPDLPLNLSPSRVSSTREAGCQDSPQPGRPIVPSHSLGACLRNQNLPGGNRPRLEQAPCAQT